MDLLLTSMVTINLQHCIPASKCSHVCLLR